MRKLIRLPEMELLYVSLSSEMFSDRFCTAIATIDLPNLLTSVTALLSLDPKIISVNLQKGF